jgi:hypothetical protein
MTRSKRLSTLLTDKPGDSVESKQLLDKIAQLEALIESIKKPQTVDASFDDYEDETEKIRINSDDRIKVMSLCPMPLNISTKGSGRGKLFKFEVFGEIKQILYSDLIEIMENHQNFLNLGYFLILNKKVIRVHGLEDSYSHILPKEKIEEIIQGNSDLAVDLFRSANEKQKEFIIDMIVDKAISGKEIDLNLIDKLSRVSKTKILEKIENAKSVLELENQEKK